MGLLNEIRVAPTQKGNLYRLHRLAETGAAADELLPVLLGVLAAYEAVIEDLSRRVQELEASRPAG